MKYLIFFALAITATSGVFVQDVLKEEWNSFKVRIMVGGGGFMGSFDLKLNAETFL